MAFFPAIGAEVVFLGTGTFIASSIVEADVGAASILIGAFIYILTVIALTGQPVSSGADAAIRPWQVQTSPLTPPLLLLELLAFIYINTLFVPLVGAAPLCAVPVFPVAGGALGDAGPPVSSQPVPIGAGAVVRAWSVLTLHRAETSPIVLRTLIDISAMTIHSA